MSTDNTSKYLGFTYQKLVGLEMCFDAPENSKLYLEFYGDVSKPDASYEVKHHAGEHFITSNSVDVWKTLKNHVEDYERLSIFNFLVLLTTSNIRSDSIFYGWENLAPEERAQKLLAHIPSEGVEKFFNAVKNAPKERLLDILGRFSIIEGQPKVKEKWELVSQHAFLALVPKAYRKDAVSSFIGWLDKVAVFNEVWEVDINDFRCDAQVTLGPYTSGELPFPQAFLDESECLDEAGEFVFINKMRAVGLKRKDQEIAFSCYMRALRSEEKLLFNAPALVVHLSNYLNGVSTLLETVKSKNSYSLSAGDAGTEKAHACSRSSYFESLGAPFEQIKGVSNAEKYYRDGKIHHLLNDTEFEWLYREDDL
ncbi:TPA: hypothetical protein R4Q56_005762 [Pseudomonas aeruginosa]|nr:hypothetical protein [Pseudomonas aeruginosa]